MDGLHQTLAPFDGTKVSLLSFPTTMSDIFDTLGAFQAAVVRVLDHFLSGYARNVHQEKFEIVEFDYFAEYLDLSDHGCWPQGINALLRKFLSNYVLRDV